MIYDRVARMSIWNIWTGRWNKIIIPEIGRNSLKNLSKWSFQNHQNVNLSSITGFCCPSYWNKVDFSYVLILIASNLLLKLFGNTHVTNNVINQAQSFIILFLTNILLLFQTVFFSKTNQHTSNINLFS